MKTAYTSVNDTNLDSRTDDTLSAELVDLGHDVRRKGVGGIAVLPLGQGGRLWCSGPLDLGLGQGVHPVRPDLLDAGQRQEVVGLGLGRGEVVELDRGTLEQRRVKGPRSLAKSTGMAEEVGGVLCNSVSIGKPPDTTNWSRTNLAILEFNNERSRNNLDTWASCCLGESSSGARKERQDHVGSDHGDGLLLTTQSRLFSGLSTVV